MRFATGILFLTLAVLQNSDATLPRREFLLPPTEGELPSNLVYSQGSIYDRFHPTRVPYVIDDYFLGMLDNEQYLHPIDHRNVNRVYSFRNHRLITITTGERDRLMHGLPLESSYIPERERGSSSGPGSSHRGRMGPPAPRSH